MAGIGDTLGGGFKIAEAYVEFSTKGDIKQEVTDQRNSFRDAQREMLNSKLGMEREETKISDRKKRRQQREEELTKLQEKEAKQSLEKKAVAIGRVQLAAHAMGSLPFVKGAANIASATIAGGPKAGLMQAASQFIGYGIEGARIASPASGERMDYQQQRMQATIGQAFVPAVDIFTKVLEKFSDWAGGKGNQLNMPQFSGFAEMRDRLQMEALAGLAGGGTASPRWLRALSPAAATINEGLSTERGRENAGWAIMPGAMAFRSIMDAIS